MYLWLAASHIRQRVSPRMCPALVPVPLAAIWQLSGCALQAPILERFWRDKELVMTIANYKDGLKPLINRAALAILAAYALTTVHHIFGRLVDGAENRLFVPFILAPRGRICAMAGRCRYVCAGAATLALPRL